ncbi:unannotated protein [freshwater metagenome]|uniref:Unannotated protein n=1 Tax=freshwater metagenome TaxID=449393 RepID=A0A6J6SXS8_9ZZZZ|nr:hypothetical protein [Actinomycetota bacterium]MSV70816.1 hypothetical protein [Actinomycetota bacterium]MSW13316.1 hypothetical protein [Actinomycetota bacterium]MSX47075.1 hypothetical protein [Actinomycetota bacterium]MSX91003.1 hypothetical protein [Actinomycetota bacterium]
MKKILFFLSVLLISTGLTQLASPKSANASQFDNLLFGYEIGTGTNLNQILALTIGIEGKAGPAGVAGKNGFVGMNGLAGAPGIAGAPGPIGLTGPPGASGAAGPPGASGEAGMPGASGAAGSNGAPGARGANGAPGAAVAVIQLAPGADSRCPQGGTKFIAANADISYACSGTTTGTGTISIGRGSASVTSCDDAIEVGMLSHFDTVNRRFLLDGIKVSNLSSDCEGQRLDVTLSTTAADSSHQDFTCTVLTLPDPAGADLYIARPEYNLRYGETGLLVPLTCNPNLSTMDLTNLDSIIAFQLS